MTKVVFTIVTCFTLLLVPGQLAAQAWRGMARIQGTVVDQNDKTPVAGAKVLLRSTRAGDEGPDVVTDKRGKWAALGLTGGTWNIDVEAEGYLPRQISVNLSEVQRIPPVEITLEPEPPPQPKEEVREEIVVGGETVAPEIADAIEAGNALMRQERYKEAIVEYEKAQTALPTNLPIKHALARAYYASGQTAPAIALLKDINKTDPNNATVALLLASLLVEKDDPDQAKVVIATLPEGSLTDAEALINLGILFMNKSLPQDAYETFDAAVKLDEDLAAPYYFRGLAAVQLKRIPDARRDFERVISLDPDSSEAGDAREMLKAMP